MITTTKQKAQIKKLALWVLACMTLALCGVLFGLRVAVPGPSSRVALDMNDGERVAIQHNLPPFDGLLVVISKQESFNSEVDKGAITNLINRLQTLKTREENLSLFSIIESQFDSLSIDSEALQSNDGKKTLIIAQSRSPVFDSADDFMAIPALLKDWSKSFPQYHYGYLSHATGEAEVLGLINQDLHHSLIYTTPITFIILIWAFRSLIAAILPLIIAGISLIASLGLSAIFSHFVGDISATSTQLVVLLVLAIGIDYSLFFITRAREEVRSGSNYLDAISISRKTTGIAIFWSGLIVSVSLLGLLLMHDTVLNSMAIVSIVSVLFTLASCLYVLPLFLELLPNCLKDKKNKSPDTHSIIVISSTKYPLISSLLLLTALFFVAHFTWSINLGNTMIPELLPESLQGIHTYNAIKKDFPSKAGGDISLILHGENLEAHEESGVIAERINSLNALGLRGPIKTDTSEDYLVERFKFLIDGTGNENEVKKLVEDLRHKVLPQLFSPLKIEAHLSGIVPYAIGEANRYRSRMFIVGGAVLGLSFLFLLFAFRSLVIPIKAIALNVLSTAASFGVLVIVFQSFQGSPLYTGVIESFVPPLLFAILFGLSMDYHIFMIARITEEFSKTQDITSAVRTGIKETSRTINSAALIMVSVFLVAATLELPVMRQLGIGLAAAVLIDATLIRTILLPATMILLGKLNWYLPRWLQWIPKVTV